jgi:hypothetical protein
VTIVVIDAEDGPHLDALSNRLFAGHALIDKGADEGDR